jgi:purine-binding chemotaxis protein CheW
MSELTTLNSAMQAHHDEITQYLTFVTGEETFAIGILDVKEIIEIEHMTRVPMTPDFIRGVINLRGNVVPVIDLSSRLGRAVSKVTKKSCIVLVEVGHDNENHTIGMMVDEVNEILEIDAGHTQPPPNFGTDIRTEFIRAMGRVDDQFIILLNVDHVLSVEDISALSQLKNIDPKTIGKGKPDSSRAAKEPDSVATPA